MTTTLPPPLMSEALNDSGTGIIILDQQQTILLWNSQIAHHAHTQAEHAIGKGFLELFPELENSRLHLAIEACIEQGHPAVLSQTLNKQLLPLYISDPTATEKKPMHQQVNVIPLSDQSEQFHCMLQVFNLTASYKREHYIRSREQEYRALFELAATGNAEIILASGQFKRVNRKLCEISGYAAEELLQMHIQDLIYKDSEIDSRQMLSQVEHCDSHDSEASGEFQFQTKKGNVIWCSVSICYQGIKQQNTKDPQTMVAIISIQDITEHKHYEQKLKQAKLAAEANNQAKSTFLSNMSHELRTPLNAILGFAELMSKDPTLNEEHKKFLDIINRSGKSLLRLINDVLEISRIETGKLVYQETTFSLEEMLDTLEHMFQLKAEHKGLSFETTVIGDIGDWKKGDEGHLNEILINLIGNAIKYTEKGDVMLMVTAEEHNKILFEVIDTGPGIPDKDKELIFDAFYQTEKGIAQGEGTGLGLAICQEYIALMHSDIKIKDNPAGGSNFNFTIKLEPTASLRKKAVEEHEVLGLSDTENPPRILIVEDKPDNQQLIFSMLEKVGFNLQVSNNGVEAIEAFKKWHPDLILMDIKMPVMDGIEATKQIRQLEGGKEVKILAFTASVFQEDHKPVIDAGCDGIINKPVKSDLMLRRLKDFLNIDYKYKADAMGKADSALPDMSQLSQQELEQLHEILLTGETKAITVIIDAIANEHAEISTPLKELALTFQYPLLLKLCEKQLGNATD